MEHIVSTCNFGGHKLRLTNRGGITGCPTGVRLYVAWYTALDAGFSSAFAAAEQAHLQKDQRDCTCG